MYGTFLLINLIYISHCSIVEICNFNFSEIFGCHDGHLEDMILFLCHILTIYCGTLRPTNRPHLTFEVNLRCKEMTGTKKKEKQEINTHEKMHDFTNFLNKSCLIWVWLLNFTAENYQIYLHINILCCVFLPMPNLGHCPWILKKIPSQKRHSLPKEYE